MATTPKTSTKKIATKKAASKKSAVHGSKIAVADHTKMSAKKRAELERDAGQIEKFASRLAVKDLSAKKKDRVKKSKKAVLTNDLASKLRLGMMKPAHWYDGLGCSVSPADFVPPAKALTVHGILKRAGWLPQQVFSRRKVEAKIMREISDRQAGKKYGPVDSLRRQLAELREMDPPDRATWIKLLGWWEGKDKSAFHGTSQKGSPGKKRGENVGQSRKGGKASTFGAGKKDKMWQAPDEDREPTTKVVCQVHECGAVVRSAKPFESRGEKGMEGANGKIVCFAHFNILVAVSQSDLDVLTKGMTVSALMDWGKEPDDKLIAAAEKPARRQAPVRARAVGSQTVKTVLANPALRAIFAMPLTQSGNGHGPKDLVPCMVCDENRAPAGPRWTWKSGVHDELKQFVAESETGRTCQGCGPSFFALGKAPIADQPAALAKLIESKKNGAVVPSQAVVQMLAAVVVSDSRTATEGKPPCPVPGCEMVLLKKNPYHSDVPGMDAAEGIEVCGKHMKELSQIARLQFTAERRAQLVAQVLNQPVKKDDGFDQAPETMQNVPEFGPVLA